MDQVQARTAARQSLEDHSFHLKHESTAVAVYVHPENPNVIVRIGTTRAVAERDGREFYRSPISEFVLKDMLARSGAS